MSLGDGRKLEINNDTKLLCEGNYMRHSINYIYI